ncbi:MAG: phosphoglucosamine mutase [Myxococcales bacterium]|nr:phosphoglucosamine mutase [Myxococcales bacterium]MCB9642458.1 phosphoglucosamine mutase [Myxococcales bacterium]
MAAQKQFFGTDGIRGVVNKAPMTTAVAHATGIALVHWLRKQQAPLRVVVGRDTRRSGSMIEAALAAGAASMGADVSLKGVLPTPAVAWLTCNEEAGAGVMISASHNPFQDNGIKLFDGKGFKLSDEVELGLEDVMKRALAGEIELPGAEEVGEITFEQGAAKRFVEQLRSAWSLEQDLSGMRVVLDAANGAGSWVGPAILEALGAEVFAIHDQPDGLNINEDCGSLSPQVLQDAVKEHGAQVGLALDGDADRLIVVDETGTVLDGDHLMMMAAIRLSRRHALPGQVLVTTVMSNLGLERALKKHGIRIERTPVGDRYVSARMRELGATLGGEQSGHLIFSDYSTTGDGLLAALQLLELMVSEDKPLSALASELQRYPQILRNFPVREKLPWREIPTLLLAVETAEAELGDEGRVLVRYSGTENKMRIMVEGPSFALIERIVQRLQKCFEAELGLS